MLQLLIGGLIAGPLLEIGGFIVVGRAIGVLPTLALIIASGVLGALVLRWKGLTLPLQMRAAMAEGRMPGKSLADGALVGLAGILLIIPGFLSDIVALLLLIPFVRGLIYRFFAGRFQVVNVSTAGFAETDPKLHRKPDTIELESDEWRDGQ